MKKYLRLFFGLGISAVFVYLALRGLNLQAAFEWLKKANYYWLIPGVLIYFVGVWGRTWRWHYMLRPIKEVPMWRLFSIVCIGYMGNNIFPVRAGEVLRSYVLKRTDDIPMSASIATIVVERVFDGLVMLLFVFIALPFVPIPDDFRIFVVGASAAFLIALALFFFFATQPELTQGVYENTVRRLIPPRLRDQADAFLGRFLEGLLFFRSGRDVIMVFVTSVFIWLAETVKYWFVMQGFAHLGGGFPVPFFVLMLMNGIVNLATTIPSAPGYVGTFDAPGIAVLTAYGVNKELAFGYTVVLHVALWFPITILGLWYFRRRQLAWSDVETAQVERTSSLSSG
ncbi:MAG: lysylphosphatidylglycerol synthase transmembrane domain-containing protein [Chloroflexota bacterium]|nr:lysylphosphatidylglycerol synthase transmembrane domain-containing protein [Chloroflexota bacterium]